MNADRHHIVDSAEHIAPGLWEELAPAATEKERIAGEGFSYGQDVWRRFTRNKMALMGLWIIILLVLSAVFVPFFWTHNYHYQELTYANVPPLLPLYDLGNDQFVFLNKNFKLYQVARSGKLLGLIKPKQRLVAEKQILYELNGRKYRMDYTQLPVRLLDENANEITTGSRVWNKTYFLGTDALGRDLFIRQIYGARISLLVALIATVVNFVIGVLYGGISGYLGGTVDNVMMRIVEIINTIPLTLYVILIMVLLESGFTSIVLAIGTVFWVDMARIVRGQILTLKEQEFVYAAKTMGAGTRRILFRHLLPNTMGPIIVTLAMLIPGAIFIEAFMSFIGLGVAPPMASWGTLCSDALGTFRSFPYQLFIPALAISITMFAFNFLVDGLRDALDPRLRK
ncbi:MAG: ABC transporter permease [Desulfobacteraceae bacterium]|nr:ABC transporter permease [Desulfobacteraceae bacterium]